MEKLEKVKENIRASDLFGVTVETRYVINIFNKLPTY